LDVVYDYKSDLTEVYQFVLNVMYLDTGRKDFLRPSHNIGLDYLLTGRYVNI